MKVNAIGRAQAKQLAVSPYFIENELLISISTTLVEMEEMMEVAKEGIHTHFFHFGDVESQEEISEGKGILLFDEEHAQRIINIIKNLPLEIERIYVHCDAGVCRSGAVAEFIVDIMHLDRQEFVRLNPCILPNIHVKRTLWRVLAQEA